jgi:uncharacterized protein (DUF2252 family)
MSKSSAAAKSPAGRQAILLAAQNSKMARSAHAYVRGNTVQFYAWLRDRERGAIPAGPPVWICGDCHAGNLGPVANADGQIDIQIRDLDQTVIRELLPQDLKLEIDQLTRDEAVHAAKYLAGVVGMAHARQMAQNVRKQWRVILGRNRIKRLNAPSWLWSSVVDLIANHEIAYLEHCRTYAQSLARA